MILRKTSNSGVVVSVLPFRLSVDETDNIPARQILTSSGYIGGNSVDMVSGPCSPLRLYRERHSSMHDNEQCTQGGSQVKWTDSL
jgi:hypothetical protein